MEIQLFWLKIKHTQLKKLLLFFLIVHIHLVAQESFKTIKGKIMDVQTKKGIPFVNIQLKQLNVGTATNSSGDFVFRIPNSNATDTLNISCVGYKTLKKPLY